MTIEQTIEQYEQYANFCKYQGLVITQEEMEQLAEWLRELQERRKDCDYWQEKARSYEQTIHKLTEAIGHEFDYQYCAFAERRTDGEKTGS